MSKAVWLSEEAHAKLKKFARRHGFKMQNLGEYMVLEGLKTLEGFPSFELVEREGAIIAKRDIEIVRKDNRYLIHRTQKFFTPKNF